ncbi:MULTISPECIES: hypothetical protein [Sphingobacterium]|uniref:DUF6712 family protein n=1 Tax=Sphingobacterium TaxID=28453 RepID=UPI0013D9D159|nr:MULTISPECIES: hypothetical protein [unclassified Sphingobacterium]
MKVYLINIYDIKSNSIVASNTDDNILLFALNEVTDLELQPLIGEKYLKKLNTGVDKGTLTNKDKEVIKDVIKPFLIYGTVAYALPYLHNKVNNKGVNVSTDATLTAKSSKEVDSFQQLIMLKFDSYKKRLIDYFKSDNDEETNTNVQADTTSASMGIFIPDRIDISEHLYNSQANKTRW